MGAWTVRRTTSMVKRSLSARFDRAEKGVKQAALRAAKLGSCQGRRNSSCKVCSAWRAFQLVCARALAANQVWAKPMRFAAQRSFLVSLVAGLLWREKTTSAKRRRGQRSLLLCRHLQDCLRGGQQLAVRDTDSLSGGDPRAAAMHLRVGSVKRACV